MEEEELKQKDILISGVEKKVSLLGSRLSSSIVIVEPAE